MAKVVIVSNWDEWNHFHCWSCWRIDYFVERGIDFIIDLIDGCATIDFISINW